MEAHKKRPGKPADGIITNHTFLPAPYVQKQLFTAAKDRGWQVSMTHMHIIYLQAMGLYELSCLNVFAIF